MQQKNDRTRLATGALVLAAIAVVAAAAAAPDAKSTAARAASPAASGSSDPRAGGLEVALGEWTVTLESKLVRPGPVTFVIVNRGTVVHGFEIRALRDGDREGEHDDLETGKLRPGESARLSLDLTSGRYEIECFVEDHDDMGMVARLDVRANAPLTAAPEAAANEVAIKGFAFRPALLRAKVGATVRWRNQDGAPHTATANSRAFDSRTLARGAAYSRRFVRSGTYAYLCAIHPQMTGKIVVR